LWSGGEGNEPLAAAWGASCRPPPPRDAGGQRARLRDVTDSAFLSVRNNGGAADHHPSAISAGSADDAHAQRGRSLNTLTSTSVHDASTP
jgi:hypothetical protein